VDALRPYAGRGGRGGGRNARGGGRGKVQPQKHPS
jgi:hypothetical protein